MGHWIIWSGSTPSIFFVLIFFCDLCLFCSKKQMNFSLGIQGSNVFLCDMPWGDFHEIFSIHWTSRMICSTFQIPYRQLQFHRKLRNQPYKILPQSHIWYHFLKALCICSSCIQYNYISRFQLKLNNHSNSISEPKFTI